MFDILIKKTDTFTKETVEFGFSWNGDIEDFATMIGAFLQDSGYTNVEAVCIIEDTSAEDNFFACGENDNDPLDADLSQYTTAGGGNENY